MPDVCSTASYGKAKERFEGKKRVPKLCFQKICLQSARDYKGSEEQLEGGNGQTVLSCCRRIPKVCSEMMCELGMRDKKLWDQHTKQRQAYVPADRETNREKSVMMYQTEHREEGRQNWRNDGQIKRQREADREKDALPFHA